jgi:hypothetical protein
MTTDTMALPQFIQQLLTPLDWFHASNIVNSATGFVTYLNAGAFALIERVSELPVVGAAIASALISVWSLVNALLAFVGVALVVALILISGLVSAGVGMIIGSFTDVLGLVDRVVRMVHGA